MKPSDELASRIHKLLQRAAPEALGTVTDLVYRAQADGLSDGEVMNMLCARYDVAHDGWPVDMEKRKRLRVKRFFENNKVNDDVRLEALLRQCAHRDEGELLASLYQEFGRDELGESMDPVMRVREKLLYVLRRCAPDKVGALESVVVRYQQRPHSTPEAFVKTVCDTYGVGEDGWPGHPRARRRARLTRFFATNCPEDLRKVDALMDLDTSESEIMAELYALYGKNEVGEPVRSTAQLRGRLTAVLEAAAPERLAAMSTIVAYGERNKLSDDQMISLVCEQLHVGEDGWPTDPSARLRARLERFFVTNAPLEMHKVDRLLKLKGASEDEVMRQLYGKYNADEFGRPVQVQQLADDLEDRVAEFYEERVPEAEVVPLTKQALEYKLPEDQLFDLLRQRYRGIEAAPNAVRTQIRQIFRRVGEPDAAAQTRSIMLLKRRDNLSDADVIAAVSGKFGVRADGWPKDATLRCQRRLRIFFEHNDPSRLSEVAALCKDLATSTKAEQAYFDALCDEYGGVDEFGEALEEPKAPSRRTSSHAALSARGTEASVPLSTAAADELFMDGELQTEGVIRRPFMPGMTQVWPPPDLGSAEALYRSALLGTLVRKYGGSTIDYGSHEDAFARLSRHYDDPADDTWQLPAERTPAAPAKPRQQPIVALGSFASPTLQQGRLPNTHDPVQRLATAAQQTLDQMRAERRKHAERLRVSRDEMIAQTAQRFVATTEELHEYGPGSGPAADGTNTPRGRYRVTIPDHALPAAADFEAARQRASRTVLETPRYQLPLPEPGPRWVAEEERYDLLYPLSAVEPRGIVDNAGKRPLQPTRHALY
jgi:hypothetical protein